MSKIVKLTKERKQEYLKEYSELETNKERINYIIETYKLGYSYSDLANIFGKTIEFYVQLLERYDIKVCRNLNCDNPCKSRSYFYTDNSTHDKLMSSCKTCQAQNRELHKQKNQNFENILSYKKCSNVNCPYGNQLQPISNFYKSKSKPDGYNIYCKVCSKKRNSKEREQNRQKNLTYENKLEQKICGNPDCPYGNIPQSIQSFHKNNLKSDGFDVYCKICSYERKKERNKKIKEVNKILHKTNQQTLYYKKCKDPNCLHGDKPQSVENFHKTYQHADGFDVYCKVCSARRRKSNRHKFATYGKSAEYLASYEVVRPDPNNNELLQVKCKNSNCQKWFNPINAQVQMRINTINGYQKGDNSFYCSEDCKHQCPIYNQKLYKKTDTRFHEILATNREVQSELRKMKIEEIGYICQRCANNNPNIELHCHHKEGIQHEPLESADLDVVMLTCKECHKEIHKIPGCTYDDMKCN